MVTGAASASNLVDGQPALSPAPAGIPGQPQSGSSPVTGPVPNRGAEAGGLAKLGQVVRLLENLAPSLGAASEAGRDVYKAIQTLAKHVPPGSMSQGIENNALEEMKRKQQQMAPMIAAMRAGQSGGAPPQAA